MKKLSCDYKEVDYSNFEVLLCDPPWDYNDKNPSVSKKQVIYKRWNNKEGLEFLFNLSANYLFLWTTNSMLEQVFKIDYNKYGWEYKQILTWLKLTSKGNISFGLGNNFRNCTEQLLLFVRKGSKPLRLNKRNFLKEISNKRTEKPKSFELELIEFLESKGLNCCYIFSGFSIDIFEKTNLTVVDIFD